MVKYGSEVLTEILKTVPTRAVIAVRLCLLLLLLLPPLAGTAQLMTVAQYNALQSLPLDQLETPTSELAHDSLTKELLARRVPEKPVSVVRVSQTTAAAAAFAKKPLPFVVASPQQLATYLTQPFQDERLKAWALYVWMAANLTYDRDYRTPARRHLVRLNPLEVLLYRKSICQGYANLYCELALKARLKAVVATGWFKGTVPGAQPGEHAWNLVKINGQWENLDVLCYDPLYPEHDFLLEPNEFQRTHYADRAQMRLASRRISLAEFQQPTK